MKKEKNASGAWEQELARFLSSSLAEQAAQGLSESATVGLHVDGKSFVFRRENGKNTLARVTESAATDLEFWVPLSTLRHILARAELPQAGIGSIGVNVFEHIFLLEEERKIKFRVSAGVIGLWSRGYFSILKAGGPEVASYLARFGFHSMARIKEFLKKVRS